jgi:REP element-mobilizing transposase RayT
MSEKYQNKYNIKSNRLQNYDYSSDGVYFITICTKNHIFEFGNIKNEEMFLNSFGEIIKNEWEETKKMRTNFKFGEFCIMPNHFHALITKGDVVLPAKNVKLPQTPGFINEFKSPKNSIGSMIGGFKSACTNKIRKMNNASFEWQANYYDIIVRDSESFDFIENYIKSNPAKWEDDRYYKI